MALNCFVRCKKFQSMPPAVAIADIAESKTKYFMVFGAIKGYHQCPLDKEIQLLSRFITPFRCYKFLHAPYDLSSISEHYNLRMY